MSHRLALRDLVDVVRPGRPVASVYLGSSPLRPWRARWHRLADQLRCDGGSADVVASIGEVLQRARSLYPAGDTLVAFAGEELPARVFHTPGLRHLDLAWFSSPAHVLPVLAWLQERPPRVVVTAGRCCTDLVAGSEHVSLNYPETDWLPGVRSAAAACTEMLERQEARLLLVAGEDEVVGALWEALPAPVRRDVAVRWTGRDLTPSGIAVETRAAARSWTDGVLDDFNDRGRARNLAVEGVDHTLEALAAGRLDDLLVACPEDVTATAWYGPAPTDVARCWAPARRCGLLADVAVRAALLSGTRVHVIKAGLSAPFEGIGGLCRAQLSPGAVMTTELVPLRTGFDVAWLGYRRDQVQYFVSETERDLALLAADRDAAEARSVSLARNLEAARTENRALQDRIDRLCRQPLSPDAVGERLRHAVDTALAEAAAIVERASAIEDHVWVSAQQTHAEHRDLLTTTRERMSRLVREGEARRRALDEAAARHRAQLEKDFELALALRRKEALRDAQLIEETARLRAERMLREAARQVEVLREHRDRVADVLRVVHALLGRAAGHLRVGERG